MTGNIRYDGPDTTVQTRQFPPWCPEIPAVVVATDGKQGGHLLLSNRHVFADEIEFPESDLSCVLGFLQWYCLNVMAWSTSLLQNAMFFRMEPSFVRIELSTRTGFVRPKLLRYLSVVRCFLSNRHVLTDETEFPENRACQTYWVVLQRYCLGVMAWSTFCHKMLFFRMEPSFVRIGFSMRIGPFSDGIASVLWCGQLVAPKCCVFQNGTEFRKNRTSHTY